MHEPLQRSPVYQQLNQRLRSALATEYKFGDRFLTERQIATQYEVSRATANKALASLVSEGVLEFRRGVGTFVQRDVIDYDVQSLVSFTEKARAAGKKPSTQLLSLDQTFASKLPSEIATALEVTGDDTLWEMNRLRQADGVAVILEHRLVVGRHCVRLTKSQASGSLYRAWTENHGLQIAGADEIIRAVTLNTREAKHLGVTARSPALEVVSVGRLENNSPLWWERTLYRGDQYEFHSRLGPIQTATPARGKFRDSKQGKSVK